MPPPPPRAAAVASQMQAVASAAAAAAEQEAQPVCAAAGPDGFGHAPMQVDTCETVCWHIFSHACTASPISSVGAASRLRRQCHA